MFKNNTVSSLQRHWKVSSVVFVSWFRKFEGNVVSEFQDALKGRRFGNMTKICKATMGQVLCWLSKGSIYKLSQTERPPTSTPNPSFQHIAQSTEKKTVLPLLLIFNWSEN